MEFLSGNLDMDVWKKDVVVKYLGKMEKGNGGRGLGLVDRRRNTRGRRRPYRSRDRSTREEDEKGSKSGG